MKKENGNKAWERVNTLSLLAAVCALTVFACLFAYRFDNKYTAGGPKASHGLLELDEQDLERYPALILTDGWEYYGGSLLEPEDFIENPPIPDEYIFIGQRGGFETADGVTPPHGSASYRLNIAIPDEPGMYMLELPEIYSAYRLYINGEPVMAMGDPDPRSYRPETGNRTVSVYAQENIEILVAASDFSHLYSGMTYPPAFGLPEAVSSLLNARFLFRGILCVAAVTIGLLSLLVGLLSRKNMLAVLYGLLCLLFVAYTAYPIVRTFVSSYYPLYAIESFSFCAMFLVIMLIQRIICGINDKWSRLFLLFGLAASVASVALHIALPSGRLWVMLAYSALVSAYEWITAGFITFTAVRAVMGRSVYSRTLLCGVLVFDCALVMDRLLPLHEPIITGWFPELASFVLVLSIGVATGKEVAVQYKNIAILHEQANSLDKLSVMQQAYYSVLEGKAKEMETIRHNLRHHFILIDGFLKNRQYESLEAYIAEYRAAVEEGEPEYYCSNNIINVLANHYDRIAEQNRIHFEMRCDMDGEIRISDSDLCSLFGNLLENAVDACLRMKTGRRFIRVGIVRTGNSLTIRVWNSTDGGVKQSGNRFLSSKGEDREGYGLYSVKSIAEKYDGTVQFNWSRDEKVFDSMTTLTV